MDGEKGGRGTLKILRNSQLKHPIVKGVSAQVLAGRELAITAWKKEKDLITFTLDQDELIERHNTWQILESDCEFTLANPEVKKNTIIGRVPTIELPRLGQTKLDASVIPGGNFSWAEATHDGTRLPNLQVYDGIVRIAQLAQEARDRLNKPMTVTSWYRTPQANKLCQGAKNSRHLAGDALDFVCDGLTGRQLYNLLDPWWPGGLGIYPHFPQLCHLDARGYKARWGTE